MANKPDLSLLLVALNRARIPFQIVSLDDGDIHFRVRITNSDGLMQEGTIGDVYLAGSWLYTEAVKGWPDKVLDFSPIRSELVQSTPGDEMWQQAPVLGTQNDGSPALTTTRVAPDAEVQP
jgi:hypothetical protein